MEAPRWEAGPGAMSTGRGITGPVTYGSVELDRLQSAIFAPDRLYEELDLAHFHGRTSVVRRIDAAIAGLERGYVVIRGEAGVGKSALAAHLVWTRPCVHHFTCLEPRARIPVEARRNLAAQLLLTWGLANQFTPDGVFPAGSSHPDWLLNVIRAAAEARNRDPQRRYLPIVLVVDGLDEAETDPPGMRTGIPLGLPRPNLLPAGVYVIVTSRSGIAVTPQAYQVDIEVRGADSLADMHAYLTRVLTGPQADPALTAALARCQVDPEWFTRTLTRRCYGVWLYLRYVLDEIRTDSRDPREVVSLPAGLHGYYLQHIHQWAHQGWLLAPLLILATIAALHRPVTADELTAIIGLSLKQDYDDVVRGVTAYDKVITWLTGGLQLFLKTVHTPTGVAYTVRHQSLRDLFTASHTDKLQPAVTKQLHDAWRTAHTNIAHHLTPPAVNGKHDWAGIDDYARIHIADHAAHADILDPLTVEPDFLTAVSPWSLLRHRGVLTTEQARANVTTLELATTDNHWDSYTMEDRQWWLHVWARKTGNHTLADALTARHPHWSWTTQSAAWAGPTHRTLTGRHTHRVVSVAAVPLPDGRTLIASGSHDQTACLWDPITGHQVGQPLMHKSLVLAVAAVPLSDGRTFLATGGSDATVRLWDPTTGQQVGPPLTGHEHAVNAMATVPLPDGRIHLATGSHDQTVRLWDPITGHQVGQPLTGHTGWVNVVTAVPLPDGRTLIASGGDDATVRLWDPTTGQQVGQPLAHDKAVQAMAAIPLPDGVPSSPPATVTARCSCGTPPPANTSTSPSSALQGCV